MGPDDFERIRPQIDRIAASVCKRKRLNSADCDDFRQHVYLKILENDCAVLRKFKGNSSISTYFVTVIERLFFQYRYQLWGKWRPSAKAKCLGSKAILLEQMLTRDGHTLEEVIQVLTTGNDPIYTRGEIEALHARLPVRQPRTTFVPESSLPDPPAPNHADDTVMYEEREGVARMVRQALDDAIGSLDAEDQLILRMRFWHAKKVPLIASALHLEQKKLYKRIDRLIIILANHMQCAGVDRDDALDVLRYEEHNLTLPASNDPEKGSSGPSHEEDGDLGGGTGRRGDDDDDD